jgi:hypothetical protein
MSEEKKRHEVTLKKVVCEILGMDAVVIRQDIRYGQAASGPLTMDIYYPREAMNGTQAPVVLFVAGFPDPALRLSPDASSSKWRGISLGGDWLRHRGLSVSRIRIMIPSPISIAWSRTCDKIPRNSA